MRVLGIDLASSWKNLGSALLVVADDGSRVLEVRPGVIEWPSADFSPQQLAEHIDGFARAQRVAAIALDGPQGWRDPATSPTLRGVGRRCELSARTQGKVGVKPRTYPANQRAWIEHSIETFTHLLARPDVTLADHAPAARARDGGYLVAECFPTSAWRTAGLVPLPSKTKCASLEPYYASLAATVGLPHVQVTSHDDLQAIVAALTAAGVAGASSFIPVRHGEPARDAIDPADGTSIRVEGIIWDVLAAQSTPTAPGARTTSTRRRTHPSSGSSID